MKAFTCNLNFSKVLTKREEIPRDTAHLSLFKIYLKIVLQLQTEEKLETTTGFHVIYQTRERVFHQDIQTPRSGLEKRGAAEFF